MGSLSWWSCLWWLLAHGSNISLPGAGAVQFCSFKMADLTCGSLEALHTYKKKLCGLAFFYSQMGQRRCVSTMPNVTHRDEQTALPGCVVALTSGAHKLEASQGEEGCSAVCTVRESWLQSQGYTGLYIYIVWLPCAWWQLSSGPVGCFLQNWHSLIPLWIGYIGQKC